MYKYSIVPRNIFKNARVCFHGTKYCIEEYVYNLCNFINVAFKLRTIQLTSENLRGKLKSARVIEDKISKPENDLKGKRIHFELAQRVVRIIEGSSLISGDNCKENVPLGSIYWFFGNTRVGTY